MQEKEKSAGKGQKKSWFQGLKSEFRKIIWTDRNTLIKQTVVVVIVTILLGVIISGTVYLRGRWKERCVVHVRDMEAIL